MTFVVITYVNAHFFQKLSYNSLRNSFDSTPQCDLVFHPTTTPGKSSFFVVMAFTQAPSSKTVMYASTAIKKVFIMKQNITVKNLGWGYCGVEEIIAKRIPSLSVVYRYNSCMYCTIYKPPFYVVLVRGYVT